MPSSGATISAPPARTNSPGMPQTTALSSASAMVRPPAAAAGSSRPPHRCPCPSSARRSGAPARYAPWRWQRAGRRWDASDTRRMRRRGHDDGAAWPHADDDVRVAPADIDGPGPSGTGRVTSMTRNAQSRSSRRDSGPVNAAGMCWATRTGQGNRLATATVGLPAPAGPRSRCRPGPRSRALPRHPGHEHGHGCTAGRARLAQPRRASGRARSRTRSVRRSVRRRRARDAARTRSTSAGPNSSIASEIAPSGLAMKSTAPSCIASSVTSAPAAVSDETMTTGQGRSTMIRSRHAKPSRFGMCTSRVTTSGRNACSC